MKFTSSLILGCS